ncbi:MULTISPECIES: Imm50 family immunity protein [unclassified Paenibacillus]|uniref:Imm50 family immunity protein n=1 Tax=unclassified Paenibacillus TaxID=185978 RepID=UPI0009A6D7FB|nr:MULTISPECIES: Imm50 family immunity protein [unclassified Paenibacillus]SLK12015.1 Immunity protein 50 [Paenibacillus sp. RU5A]SOC72488.1 Immunity protein 50 [Paenibacillus sp. RU26A]SOC74901.1 Immunity protein 50 [Paenibacillus sp. RU5M]
MNQERTWNVSIKSVEREEFYFAPNTGWQVKVPAFRVHFNSDCELRLHAQDQILITVGEIGTAGWAAFIGTAIECGPDSILLYTSPQYDSRLMEAWQFEMIFSPLNSIEGAQNVIDTLGFFPPFHYDELTNVKLQNADQGDKFENLSLTITHTSTDGLEQPLDFNFEDVQFKNISPAEESNVCLQLSFAYEGEQIGVQLDAIAGFAATFLCRKVVVQLGL